MKNFIILLCFTGVSLACLSQNVVQVEYFVDTDAGYGKNNLLNVTPVQDGSFPFTVNLSSFLPGYHKLYIRTKDSDGKWSLTARRNIEVLSSQSKTTIVRGEYFFDTDPGFDNGIPVTVITPDSSILQNFSAIATGLHEGYHKLYGRFLDNQGKWSLTFRRNMEVYKSINTLVTKAEYFFTDDLGVGDCASVTFGSPSADGTFSSNIPCNTIPAGADTLFIRVQDDIENKWSITQWKNGITAALPLTLLNFIVTKQNAVAQINWQTVNEVNTAYFNVQRSTDGTNFTTIGKVLSDISGGLQHDYMYSDGIANIRAGKVYYRLQMVDNDGKIAFSKIVYINITAEGLRFTIYPNPAHIYFVIKNDNFVDVSNANIVVRDLMGRKLITQKFNNNSEQRINIASLSKGIYMVSIDAPGNVQSQKLVVE